MVSRVLIANDKIRISKAGDDVTTTALSDLAFHEQMKPLKPAVVIDYVFSGSGDITKTLPFNPPDAPFCILKSSDNTLPEFFNYYAHILGSFNKIMVRNRRNISRTISAYVYLTTPLS